MSAGAKAAKFLTIALFSALISSQTALADIKPRPGWSVHPTSHDYSTLVERVLAAAKTQKIGVVSRASATVGAKAVLDLTIPGNTVIGLYHPRFAVRMLEASVTAGIEAPIRVYLTENEDGSATLSFKTPTHVFEPYFDEGGDRLRELAQELDQLFADLAKEAAGAN